jgi:hypothetical protein
MISENMHSNRRKAITYTEFDPLTRLHFALCHISAEG